MTEHRHSQASSRLWAFTVLASVKRLLVYLHFEEYSYAQEKANADRTRAHNQSVLLHVLEQG